MRRLHSALVVLLIAVLAAAGRAQSAAAVPGDLDAYVARAMRTFSVPGLALSVVKDGKALVARGYGVRQLGDPVAVDAQTLFGIASNTKVVTATALGLLVEEKKIQWVAPVIHHVRAEPRWHDRSGQDAGGIAGDGFSASTSTICC